MPSDPSAPLDSLLLFLEYGGELTVTAYLPYDEPGGDALVGVHAECRNPFNDDPASRSEIVPKPRGESPIPLAGSVFASLYKAANEAAEAAEIAAWEEAVEGVAGEIEGVADADDDLKDDGDDFQPEGEADDDADATPDDAGETLADLAIVLGGPGEPPLSPADAESGREGDDAATLYDFLKAAGRVTIRIGTTPEELYFPYVSVVASGKPLGEGKRQAAVIDPAQLQGSEDRAAELTAAVARAIRGVAGERVN